MYNVDLLLEDIKQIELTNNCRQVMFWVIMEVQLVINYIHEITTLLIKKLDPIPSDATSQVISKLGCDPCCRFLRT